MSGKSARWWGTALGMLATIALAAVLGFTSLSALESSCGMCHDEAVEGLVLSGHAGVACRECHRGPGLADVIDFRVRLAAMAPAALGMPYHALQGVPSSRCLSCHERVIEELVVSKGIRMSHAAPHRAGYECGECHASLAHGDARRPGIAMDECLRCHAVSALSQDCDTCHVGQVTRESRLRDGSFSRIHGPEWRTAHGSGNLKTCAACHTATRCESCHQVPIPHPDQWLNTHGRASNGADCRQCHASSFCSGCHGLEMPHPAGFLAEHSTVTEETGPEACESCHSERACESCHSRHTHPGLTAERVQRLRSKAGLDVR